MKPKSALRLRSLLFALLMMAALTACVRTIDNGDDGGGDLPTAEPLVMPTSVPVDTPVSEPPVSEPPGPEPTAVIEATTDATTEGAAPTETTGAAETADAPGSYTVQTGDTLGQIAQQFGVTVEALAIANGIANLDTLDVGQALTIPIPGAAEPTAAETPDTTSTEEQIHIVKAGENLFRIGLAYGFTIDELAEYNGIANPNSLEVGQEIRIPPSN